MNNMEKTIVVFRRWNEKDCGVIALFPEIEHRWPYCSSYEHLGQHSGADYSAVIAATAPIPMYGGVMSDDDAQLLKSELESIGYNLAVRRKYIRRKK